MKGLENYPKLSFEVHVTYLDLSCFYKRTSKEKNHSYLRECYYLFATIKHGGAGLMIGPFFLLRQHQDSPQLFYVMKHLNAIKIAKLYYLFWIAI